MLSTRLGPPSYPANHCGYNPRLVICHKQLRCRPSVPSTLPSVTKWSLIDIRTQRASSISNSHSPIAYGIIHSSAPFLRQRLTKETYIHSCMSKTKKGQNKMHAILHRANAARSAYAPSSLSMFQKKKPTYSYSVLYSFLHFHHQISFDVSPHLSSVIFLFFLFFEP